MSLSTPNAPERRIITADDDQAARQRARQAGHNVTFQEMWEYTEGKVDEVSQFYMGQIPAMLRSVMSTALIAYVGATREGFQTALNEYTGPIEPAFRTFLQNTFGIPAEPTQPDDETSLAARSTGDAPEGAGGAPDAVADQPAAVGDDALAAGDDRRDAGDIGVGGEGDREGSGEGATL